MKKSALLFTFLSFLGYSQLLTPYEKGNGNQTTTYQEMRAFYQKLSQQYPQITVYTKGEDDNGDPIDVVIFNPFGKPFEEARKGKSLLFVNNGIHPGEPDGIDATMMLMRNLATGKVKAPRNVIFAAIASYNISGMLNRSGTSRANQNGPEEYGFRGNARNYDLNRDFIKSDSKNSKSFQSIYQWLQPDVFIDNHVSNGADYQYLFTYISTQKERLGKVLGDYFNNEMQRTLIQNFEKKGIISTPYVNVYKDIPDIGFPAFIDSPRYSTGYTTLFNTIGTVVETHMWKPYQDRVKVTYEYMVDNLRYMDEHYKTIQQKRAENLKQYKVGGRYAIAWKLDSTKYEILDFRGFEAKYKPSDISGKTRLWYDRQAKFSKPVRFYNSYKPAKEISIPKYYVIPQSEYRVLDLLRLNQIKMKALSQDSTIVVESYRIRDFKTLSQPFEGHYVHYDTSVSREQQERRFRKGDYLVPLDQPGIKYLLETLEPEAIDSFFNWNFFDAILGMKEHYSAYIFEDTAAELLKSNAQLRAAFEEEKRTNPQFAEDGQAQLDWIYKHSDYYEKTHRLYPIYRIN